MAVTAEDRTPTRLPSAPRLAPTAAAELPDDLDERFPDLDGVDLHGQHLAFAEARTVTFLRSRLTTCALDLAEDAVLDAQDAELVDLDLTGRRIEGLRRVSLVGCRLGGADFGDARIRDVTFEECVLDLASMRSAHLDGVAFLDSRIDELDLSRAELTDVTIRSAPMAGVALDGARLTRVDLTGADLAGVVEVASLRGAVISEVQTVALARRFAQLAGVRVASTDE